MGSVSLGYGPDGKRIRRKVSGKTKQEVRAKLEALHQELNAGVRSSSTYTVREAVDDWLREGLDGPSDRTRTLYEGLLGPVLDTIGAQPSRHPLLHPVSSDVNGHWEIRLGGLVFSGLAATSFPGWWPRVLPAGGVRWPAGSPPCLPGPRRAGVSRGERPGCPTDQGKHRLPLPAYRPDLGGGG